MPPTNDIVIRNLVKKQTDQNPERIFIQQAEDGESLSFKALYELTNRMGHGLQSLEVKQGDTVLTMVPARLESVYLWLGCCNIGSIEVPVNNAYKGNMLSHIVNDSKAKVMFIDNQFVDRILKEEDKLEYLETLVVLRSNEQQRSELRKRSQLEILLWDDFISHTKTTETVLSETIAYRNAACLLYTSGTTGPSKGVIWSYAQGHENGSAGASYLDGDDIFYSPFPSNHISQKLFVYRFLEKGGKIVLRNGFSVRAFWSDIRKFNCTGSGLLGAMADFLIKQPATPADADNPLKAIFLVPLIKEVNEIRKRFDIKVYSFFNMTEICPVTFISDEELSNNQSCGRLREGFDARLVDHNDQEVPVGKVGELILRPHNPWVFMRGYWSNPEKTIEAWQNLWMHTGDMFYKDEDGFYYYSDRKKDAIRRRGENISSMEVEREIIAHPHVLECAVIGIPSEYGEEEVKAVVLTAKERSLKPEDLIYFLKENMPHYMIPRFIEFVDEIPKTPTLKVQKTSLRETGLNENTWDREKAGIKLK
jgi:crotonobetaine/carnitine-CoA ligase